MAEPNLVQRLDDLADVTAVPATLAGRSSIMASMVPQIRVRMTRAPPMLLHPLVDQLRGRIVDGPTAHTLAFVAGRASEDVAMAAHRGAIIAA